MRKSRGYALTASLAILFIVFTLAIALQYQTSLARTTYLRAEAEFQAELALENQIAADLLELRGKAQRPSLPDDVSVSKSTQYDTDQRKGAGAQVLQRLPSTAFKKPEKKVNTGEGQQQLTEFKPGSMRPEFRIFGRARYSVVYSAGFPFAAFAPKGTIDLKDCFPGGNPPEGKIKGNPEDFRSGIPAYLGAAKKVTVTGEFPYGEVFSLAETDDSISLAKGTKGVLGHIGVLPFQGAGQDYSGQLERELDFAANQLSNAASAGDKTDFILSKALLSPKGLFKALFALGDVSLADILEAFVTPSLNQAMAFPLPTIPTFSTAILYNELTFHLPFPPDQGLYAPIQDKAKELADTVGQKLNSLGDPLREAQKKLLDLRAELDKKVTEAVSQAVAAAQGPLNQAQQQLNNLQNSYDGVARRYQKAQADLNASPASQPAKDAFAAAQKELDTLNSSINAARNQVANLQAAFNRAGDEARARIQAEYQRPIEEATNRLQALAAEAQQYVEQAKAFADEASRTIVNTLPGDPKGLATRALEDASTIDKKLGAPGVNYVALALLTGRAGANVAQRAVEQAFFRIIVRFVYLIAPGGKLVINVSTPGDYFKAVIKIQIPLFLLDPDILEAVYRLRNLSIKQALLEYLQPIIDSIPENECRVINFGHKDNPTDETFEFENNTPGVQASGFKSVCTWNVPEGRTLMLRGNVTIKGDLWLQKGSCMVIKGNLNMQRPPARTFHGIDNPLAPSGRIFLEPGSTLIVDGNLTSQGGSALSGSVVVEAPLGQSSPITSGILCRGNVSLKYGIHPGIRLDNLFGYVGALTKAKELVTIQEKVLTPLMSQLAPNAAKIFGPFHIRKPYIAQFATTLSLYFIIPGPGPTYPNILVKIFRVVASVYGISMNAALGENLYTQCEWWVFGDGTVPILPRVDAEELVERLKNIRLRVPSLTDPVTFFKARLEKFVTKVVTKVITDAVSTTLREIVTAIANVLQVGKQISIAAGAIVDTFLSQFETSIDDIIEELKKEFELTIEEGIKEFVEKPVRGIVDDLLRQLESSVEKAALRDAPGTLIYAGGSLTVGLETEPPALALGMFVAKGNIDIQAERCLGSLLSSTGNIKARMLIFNPFFTTASFYVPKDSPDWASAAWPKATVECLYGDRHDNKRSIDVGPPVFHITSQGLTQ